MVRCGIGSQAAQIGDLQGCRAPHQGLPFVHAEKGGTSTLPCLHEPVPNMSDVLLLECRDGDA